MSIQSLFEEARAKALFMDYDVHIEGEIRDSFSGGTHVGKGARLFDIASLTKACTHLLVLKLIAEGKLSPTTSFRKFVDVNQPNGVDREIWHFLSYVVQGYGFDYEALRAGLTKGSFKDTLVSSGFGVWGKRFKYDNIASAYLAILLEQMFQAPLQQIFWEELVPDKSYATDFLFHPVHRGIVSPSLVVPTSSVVQSRGLVHDPLSRHHQDTDLSVAGLFSKAEALCQVFHQAIDRLIVSGHYDEFSMNQLTRLGITENIYGLGFDLPNPKSLHGYVVQGPMIFAGWTGCRLFFSKRPRLTICFLTNRVLCGDTPQSRSQFSGFFWEVVRTVLWEATNT
jgi:hypothetical protein